MRSFHFKNSTSFRRNENWKEKLCLNQNLPLKFFFCFIFSDLRGVFWNCDLKWWEISLLINVWLINYALNNCSRNTFMRNAPLDVHKLVVFLCLIFCVWNLNSFFLINLKFRTFFFEFFINLRLRHYFLLM